MIYKKDLLQSIAIGAMVTCALFLGHKAYASSVGGTLYVSNECPNCPPAEQSLRDNCIEVHYIWVDFNNSYGIQYTPTLKTSTGQTLVGYYEINSWAESHNQCH